MNGIFLNDDDIEKLNYSYKKIKEVKREYKKEFKECPHCKGTGLTGYSKHKGGYSWSGEFCSYCNGTGKALSNIEHTVFLCNKCNGAGYNKFGICDKCNGEGVVGWVRNLTRRSE